VTSRHAGPHDRTTLESHHRLAWSLCCVRARSPPALPEPHLGRAPPEVRIAGHLPFSLSLILIRLCAFTGEGRLRYYIIVLCPSSQPLTPDALPSLRCRWPRPTERTLLAVGKMRTPTPEAHCQSPPCQPHFPPLWVTDRRAPSTSARSRLRLRLPRAADQRVQPCRGPSCQPTRTLAPRCTSTAPPEPLAHGPRALDVRTPRAHAFARRF
jgi:hypothetical protein